MAETRPEQAAPVADAPPLGPTQLVESLLFVAAEPVAVDDLSRALELSVEAVEAALAQLADALRERGIRLLRHGARVQLVAAPEAAAAIERFVGGGPPASRLSTAALETLAIIAYRQPITRAGIEALRGVDSAGAIRTLLQRGLIAEVGRLPHVGRPVLYGTTDEFLKQFGLASLDQLPPLDIPEVSSNGQPGAPSAS
ncbi:SMC-Scp complex subunit ScpB [Kallotenue papyrolyticum]|uniref:SMC-Scp complex subunit ScpB n=1 Tax=Kallotenue papyrolyticum TaxID=1325125 RepID=UPI00047862B3|nr:SMC-Scp complex subunit ScpB [Kallotenue papyrolyticum]